MPGEAQQTQKQDYYIGLFVELRERPRNMIQKEKGPVFMRKSFILSLFAMMIVLGVNGCGGGGTSADPLGTDTLTLTGSATQLAPNNTAVLSATVKSASGALVVGREVSFNFAANASGAVLYSWSATTNNAGVASVLYKAGAGAGVDAIRASLSNGAFQDIGITVAAAGGGGGAGSRIALSGSAISMATGQNSLLTATVTDSAGNPVSGQAVSFSFISNASGAAALTVLSGGLTDVSGRAVAVYTAGAGSPGIEVQDTVKAEIAGVSASAMILTRTSTTAPVSTATLSLTAGTTALTAGQSSILTARVADQSGKPLSGQVVSFRFLGGGAAASGGALTVINGGSTDANGQALAVYTAGNNTPIAGIQDTVEALVTGASGVVIITRTASTAVAPVGYRMALMADVASMAAGQSAVVTATVTDGSGNPASGQAVTFALLNNNSGASLATLNGGTTDASGKAISVYTAGATTPASSVQDTIQASVTGSTGAIVMTRTAAGSGGGTGVRMTVNATPTSLIAGAMSVIVAQVDNADGTAAPGLAVTFGFVSNNSGAPALTVVNGTTDGSGQAIATYIAGSNFAGLSIQDAVSASVTGSAGAAIITRLPATGTGNRVSLSLSPIPLLPTTSSNCIVTATVLRDDGLTPVANETVTFSIITGGGAYQNLTPPPLIVSTIAITTNNSGIANATFTAPGGATGFEAVVRAQIPGTTNGGDAVDIIYW